VSGPAEFSADVRQLRGEVVDLRSAAERLRWALLMAGVLSGAVGGVSALLGAALVRCC
jgi:hypothetical protein